MEPILKKTLVEYITGKRDCVTLVGHPVSIAIIHEAAKASRELFLSLNEGSIDNVSSALEKKRIAVERYEKVTGTHWGL
jgi:hypothetical protein